MESFTNADSIPLRHDPLTIVIIITVYLTVLAAGLLGNCFVIVVVVKTARMKTATNYFVVNLAIADLLVLICCLPSNLIYNIYAPWVLGSLMCKAVPYIQGVSVCASVYSLAAISGSRLMAIWFPPRWKVTKSAARRVIVLIWIWAAGLSLPWLFYFRLEKENKLFFCREEWPSDMYENIYFVLVILGLFYLVPLSFIFCCHFVIWLRVRHRNVPTDSSVSQIELIHQRTRDSVGRMVIRVVVAFAASWLPLHATHVWIKLTPAGLGAMDKQVIIDYVLPIAQLLGVANSCINPMLYAFFNRDFRAALQRLVPGCSAYKTPWERCTRHGKHKAGHLAVLIMPRGRNHLRNSLASNSRQKAVGPNAVVQDQ